MESRRISNSLIRLLKDTAAFFAVSVALVGAGCASGDSQETETAPYEEEVDEDEPAQGDDPYGDPPQQQPQQQPQQDRQAPQGQQPRQGMQAPAPENAEPPTEEELDAFVDTYEEVIEIQTEYRQRIDTAESPDEIQRLQQEASAEAEQAIEDGELTQQEFMTIVQQMQQDPELQQRVSEKLDARQ